MAAESAPHSWKRTESIFQAAQTVNPSATQEAVRSVQRAVSRQGLPQRRTEAPWPGHWRRRMPMRATESTSGAPRQAQGAVSAQQEAA